MGNELLRLDDEVNDALSWLRSACTSAGNLSTEEVAFDSTNGPIYRDNGWDAMHKVADNLAQVLRLLETALNPIRDVIAEERKRELDGPDEVDPHGFKYHPMA